MCPIGPHDYTVEVDNGYFTEDTYPAGRMECTPYVLCRGMHARTEYEGLGLIISTLQSPTLDSTLFTGLRTSRGEATGRISIDFRGLTLSHMIYHPTVTDLNH